MAVRHAAGNRPTLPSQNEWGLADLLPQSITLPERTALTRSQSGPGAFVLYRTLAPLPGSTLGFWTDDYRFEALWSRPHESLRRLLVHEPAQLVQPDFSTYDDQPRAVALWNLYRSRWLARWWQDAGLSVIPSLLWSAQTVELVSLGIPRGSVVACEARPRFKDRATFLAGLTRAVAEIQPPVVCLYGLADDWRPLLPPGPRYHALPAWSPRRRIHAGATAESPNRG